MLRDYARMNEIAGEGVLAEKEWVIVTIACCCVLAIRALTRVTDFSWICSKVVFKKINYTSCPPLICTHSCSTSSHLSFTFFIPILQYYLPFSPPHPPRHKPASSIFVCALKGWRLYQSDEAGKVIFLVLLTAATLHISPSPQPTSLPLSPQIILTASSC